MHEATFNPGFRFSVMDILILLGGALGATAISFIDGRFCMAVIFVVVHFFLFCNIVRMSRPLELIWAIVFAVLSALAAAEILAWPWVFALSAGLTVVLIRIESRRPSYHGVGWRFLNPELPNWWSDRETGQRKTGASTRASI